MKLIFSNYTVAHFLKDSMGVMDKSHTEVNQFQNRHGENIVRLFRHKGFDRKGET